MFTNCYYEVSKEKNHSFLISYNFGKKKKIHYAINCLA